MRSIKSLLIIIFSIAYFVSSAQQEAKKASKFFNKGEFDKALIEYNKLDNSAINISDNLKIGTCYFLSKNNQVKGIPFIEKYIQKADSIIPVAYFYLGSLYHKNYEFDKSIQTLENFKIKLEIELAVGGISHDIYTQFKKEAETIIVNCNYGKTMINSPRKVLVENLGDSINSKYQEYAPTISLNEKTLVYTSRRPENEDEKIAADGDYYEDIFISTLKKGSLFENQEKESRSEAGFFNLATSFEYSIAKRLPDVINSKDHDASIQLSNDGKKLYFYRDFDVWLTSYNDTVWTEPVQLSVVNSDAYEPSMFISLDENTMFITSEKEGGYGGLDIYVSEKDAEGNWTEMKNLGPKINTSSDEDISYVSPEKDIIYFASKGHSSMGEYDVFKSLKKDREWTSPINMGAPINSPYNDVFFVMPPRYNRGYYASERPGGKGGMDLYRLTFANERNPLAELAGLVLQGDSLVPAKSKITMLENESLMNTIQNSQDSTGEYLLLVEHGKKYEMLVETEGFAPYKKTFIIPEQVEYYQLYQEIHHVYLKDSYGNIIGQQIVTYNAFNDIETATRKEGGNDTLQQKFTKETYSKYVRDSNNKMIGKFVDVKFYISQDSLENLLKTDKKLKFLFPEYTEISFLYEEDKDFRYALNSYIEGKDIDMTLLRSNTLLVNEIKDVKELTKEINLADTLNEKPIIILFDYDNHKLSEVAKRELDIMLAYMKQNLNLKFLIKGHTDSKGTEKYNYKLSIARVKEVQSYLVSKGIKKNRLKYKGFGESLPIAPNVNIDGSDNPEGRLINRRAEFEILE